MIRSNWVDRSNRSNRSNRVSSLGNSVNSGDLTEKVVEIGLITSVAIIAIIHTSDVLSQKKDGEFTKNLNSPEKMVLTQGLNPTIEDSLNKAREYQKSIIALQTPTDPNSGFAIHPINEFRRQTRPELNRNVSQNNSLPPEIQTPSSPSELGVQKATAVIKELSNLFLDDDQTLYTNAKKTPIRRTEKPYFSIDQTNRNRLLTAANTLNLGTPRTMAKRTLGRPTKETLVADPESRQLVKMLVYTITLWKQGTPTPQKDEFIVLLFDSSDQLISLEHNPNEGERERENQFNPYNYQPPQYAFNSTKK